MTPVEVLPLKLTAKGTTFGQRFIPLTPEQTHLEKLWRQFLKETLGPELRQEEREALERVMKKFNGVTDQKVENPFFWESWGPTWAEYSRRNLNRGFLLLNRLAGITKDQRIISLGAGSGWQEVFLAQVLCPQGSVIGVDYSFHMIKQGILLAGKREVQNVCFTLAKAERIPLPEGMADLAISLHLLDLIPDSLKVLKEVKRVLKHTGRSGYFFVFPLSPGDRLPEKAAVWQTRLIESGLRPPHCFSLSGQNYKGRSIRLLGLTNPPLPALLPPKKRKAL